MGLDITAYENVQKLAGARISEDFEPVDKDGNLIEEAFIPYANPDFPEHAGELDDNFVYTYENNFSFRAGSYSGYNRWREELAKMAGYPLTKFKNDFGEEVEQHAAACWFGQTGPFSELIDFSDCEGVIGTEVCAKLLKDFENFYSEAARSDSMHFFELYEEWTKAFELGSKNGCVCFC